MLQGFSEALDLARKVSRWDEWATSKMPLVFACAYYAMLVQRQATPATMLVQSACLGLALCLYAAFGYMANAWSDRRVDTLAGKPTPLAATGPLCSATLVVLVFVAGAASVLVLFRENPDLLALFGAAYLVAALYSLPPVRLKERGMAGLCAAAVAQRVLPAAIVFQAFACWDAAAVALTCLSGLVGLRYIVVHQLQDVARDTATGVRTVATTKGSDWLSALQSRWFFPLEVIALVASTVLMARRVPWLASAGVIDVVVTCLQGLTSPGAMARLLSPVSYKVFALYYNVLLPIVASLVLAVRQPELWAVPMFTIVWLSGEIRQQWPALSTGPGGNGDA